MRMQRKNTRIITFANYYDKKPVQYMRSGVWINTGEYEIIYNNPQTMRASVSPAKGEAHAQYFGEHTDYDKVLMISGKPRFSETSILWIDIKDNGTNPHDYIVTKVAQATNFTMIAIKKVKVTERVSIRPKLGLWLLDRYGRHLVDRHGSWLLVPSWEMLDADGYLLYDADGYLLLTK